jgi:uncharacterized protein
VNIVLDTNVLVSGLLNPRGTPGRIVELVGTGHLTLMFDDRILIEYRDVLARPKLRIEPVEAGAILDLIEKNGLLVPAPPIDVILPDADDLPFLEVAEAARATLVTGNGRDFVPSQGSVSIPVVTPAAFLELWQQSRRYPSFD